MDPVERQRTYLLEPPIGRFALAGAALGLIGVVVAFAVGLALSDGNTTVMAAIGIVGPFGGAGFGAMMGAVLGGIRAADDEARATRTAAPPPAGGATD